MRIIIIIQTTDNPQFNPPRSPTLAPYTFPRLAQSSFILYNKKPFQNHPAPKTNIFWLILFLSQSAHFLTIPPSPEKVLAVLARDGIIRIIPLFR